MMDNPATFLDAFARAGASGCTVHAELDRVDELLEQARAPGLEAEGARLLEQLVYAVELGVHGAAAGAGSGEGVEEGGGIVHHELTVELEGGRTAHGLDHWRA